MNSNYGLSILVPTYNRSSQLKKLTTNILLPVAYKFKNNVEIIIRDNTGEERIIHRLNNEINLPENINYEVNHKNLEYHGNIQKLLGLATKSFIWFLGDDDEYDLQEICNLINLVLNNDKDYDAFLPCFSYRSEPLFNSNEILGFELEKITLEKLFKKNKSPFALLSSLIFPNKNLILDKVELSNAWLHAIIFLKSLNPYTSLWINKKPCIYYESVSSEGSELEQRAITLDYYVNSAIELIKCQEKYAKVKPPSKNSFHKEVVLWMIQHKGRLIYWSFTHRDMLKYALKGIIIAITKFDKKLLIYSIILLFFPKALIRLLYKIKKWFKRKDSNYIRFFKTINI